MPKAKIKKQIITVTLPEGAEITLRRTLKQNQIMVRRYKTIEKKLKLTIRHRLTAILKCPVCYDAVGNNGSPIWMCSNGHVMCNGCYAKLITCPLCRNVLHDNIRNLALERVLQLISEALI